MNDPELLHDRLESLLLYPYIFKSSVGLAFAQALAHRCKAKGGLPPSPKDYGSWFYQLALQSYSWRQWIERQIQLEPNPVAIALQRQLILSSSLQEAARRDLETLEAIATLGPSLICPPQMPSGEAINDCNEDGFFHTDQSWPQQLPRLCQHYQKHGTGIIAQHLALRWTEGHLVGIQDNDPIQLQELVGYERQKARICRNTESLLDGFAALNVLLYGARGTGKSALVKALVNDYGDRGLRLVELTKADLIYLPQAVQAVRQAPQKFIFFVDDLSFEEDEESYKALKVVLEGNLTARPPNVVVYATSNRRHLIREFFADRPRPSDADEIQSWDTVQEKLSLSDRFGLSLTFEPANQDTYLRIVFHLAQMHQLAVEPDALEFRALQWATQQNGRSGRTARQFIQALRADLNRPEPEGRFV
ncbi:MAG: ATP-binding protein [Cyanobacteria bacterium P01_F01_bin.42]